MSSKASYYDVLILGAGAAGLMCAFNAAKRGRRVLVLEKSNKVGKKILMSGGGRCNFTNQSVLAEHFISANTHFCKSALSRYTQWDFMAMVAEHSIGVEERKHGQLFCAQSAKDILAMLLLECEQAGVEIKTSCCVNSVIGLGGEPGKQLESKGSQQYKIEYEKKNSSCIVMCSSLVVATGGLSIPSLGGSGFGYDLAKQFNIEIKERSAGLVPFMFSDGMKPLCERLSGLAVAVEVYCVSNEASVRSKARDNSTPSFRENMLFTHRGLSGPAMLQISNYWHPGDDLQLNLLPDDDAGQWLLESKHQRDQGQSKQYLKTVLSQRLPKALVNELQGLWWPNALDTSLAEMPDQQLREIGEKLNNWCVRPSATEGYRTAEVTRGGVDTNTISSKTMESTQQAGLFFIGEVLDVTGHLGGFNFQWAWSSAYTAAQFV